MDITLERILSLLPRKPNGAYVHGAKAQFADSLGLAHSLVTMWENGQSRSYKDKLYEISAKYNVSVEWLKGETDEKNPPPQGSGLSEEELEIIRLYRRTSAETRQAMLQLLRAAEAGESSRDVDAVGK